MKALVAVLFVILSFESQAGMDYYPEEFVSVINTNKMNKNLSSTELRDDDLRDAIHEVLTENHVVIGNGRQILAASCSGYDDLTCYNQRSLSYKEARSYLFGKLHLRQTEKGYTLKGVYCQKEFTRSTPGIGKLGPMMIPNSNTLNCEHTWPQSRFSGGFSKGTQKGDLHHLFPTNSKANSLRSNFKFAEVDRMVNETPDCEGPKLGTLDNDGREYYYEPPKSHRGNVARALFYFSVRYKIHISENEEKFLRKWHIEDPVDAEEKERNDMIEDIQKNRNPFIDFPHLVDNINDF